MRDRILFGVIAFLCLGAIASDRPPQQLITPVLLLLGVWGWLGPSEPAPLKPISTKDAIETVHTARAEAAAGQLSAATPDGGALSPPEA